jgi:hypothetical protein
LQASHAEAVVEIAVDLEELGNAMPPIACWRIVSTVDGVRTSEGGLTEPATSSTIVLKPRRVEEEPGVVRRNIRDADGDLVPF